MAIRALSTAASGMTALQSQIDVIANNLANVNTTGFKKTRANFQDLIYQQIKQPGFASEGGQGQIPTGIQIGLGTRLVSTEKIFAQGSLERTDKDLDVAIEGDGFFRILDANGATVYTRDGSLRVDSEGRIQTANGQLLADNLTVPQSVTRVSISADGQVQGFDPTQPNSLQQIGTITLSRFINPGGLRSIGDNLYQETAASGQPIDGTPGQQGLGELRQGFIESSNVEVVNELVDMIQTQRAFEINATSIRTADEMLQTVNQLRR